MSNEVYNDIYSVATNSISRPKFNYRKSSIGKEISELFPGCVIYADVFYEAKKHRYWRISAYCAHQACRNYRLIANYKNPQVFDIQFDKETICHTKPIARQVRTYERDKGIEKLQHEFPNTYVAKAINKTSGELVEAGSYGDVMSLDVAQKMRSKGISLQDAKTDDFEDLEALQTKDAKTNFISKILPRNNFGVYIHSVDQIKALRKLHEKRQKDGVPITARLDASGNIARQLTEGNPILYHTLATNVTISHDSSTSIPLTEQYNTRNTSKDISAWLFDYVMSYHELYDDAPLMLDYLLTDFSFANFHAIQLVLNRLSLAQYLVKCYNWINDKIKNGKFPDEFDEYMKMKMCYTHLMHTFGDMTKRIIGKKKNNAQLPESRLILEILVQMIKSNSYEEILLLFDGLSTLLCNEFENEATRNVMESIVDVTVSLPDDLDLDSEDNIRKEIDINTLPENCPTLYEKNPFYHEFLAISKRNTEKFVEVGAKKNEYYHPDFLQKFLTRFVPLIPLWTCILNVEIKELKDSDLACLQFGHNQPLETYFGKFKMNLYQKAVEIGQAPVKITRAINLSREITNANIKRMTLTIPKNRLNSQRDRNPNTKRYKRNKVLRDSIVASAGSTTGSAAVASKGDKIQNAVSDTVLGSAGDRPIDELNNSAGSDEPSNTAAAAVGIVATHSQTITSGVRSKRQNDTNESVVSSTLDACVQSQTITSAGINLRTQNASKNENTEDVEDDGTSFRTASEQYKKRGRKSFFTYFDKKCLTKESTNTKKSTKIYNSNGLFKDPKIYCNLTVKQRFIVCVINEEKIDNKTFSDMPPERQSKMLQQSNSMKNLCLYCGTEDDGFWGCCTKCNRWIHCGETCGNVDPDLIKKDKHFQCFVCKDNS